MSKVYDKDGVWVLNPRAFSFSDTDGRLFPAGEKVKVLVEGWVAAQLEAKVLELAPTDPTTTTDAKPAVKPATPTTKAAPSPAVKAGG